MGDASVEKWNLVGVVAMVPDILPLSLLVRSTIRRLLRSKEDFMLTVRELVRMKRNEERESNEKNDVFCCLARFCAVVC